MNPIGAQEDEQSGVGCEVDPSPRPDLIRDSSVNCSAGGAFNTVALENHLEGVKKKPKHQDLVENNLGLGKESDETADSWSGSSWKQDLHEESVGVRAQIIDKKFFFSTKEHSSGGKYKRKRELKNVLPFLYAFFVGVYIPLGAAQTLAARGSPNNPEITPFRKTLVHQDDRYEVARLNTSYYTVAIAVTASYTCDVAFFNKSMDKYTCNVNKEAKRTCPETGLTVTEGPADNVTEVFELHVESRKVQRSFNYCIYVQAIGYFVIHSGRVDLIVPEITTTTSLNQSTATSGTTTTPTQDPKSAPITCPALDTDPLATQTGCDPDSHGRVASGSVCTFSCRSGYEGKGDVRKKCLDSGTWTTTNFTCQDILCSNTGVNGWMVSTIFLLIVISFYIAIRIAIYCKANPMNFFGKSRERTEYQPAGQVACITEEPDARRDGEAGRKPSADSGTALGGSSSSGSLA